MNATRRIGAPLAVALVLAWTAGAQGGAIFFEGEMKDGRFVPGTKAGPSCYTVRYSKIAARLDEAGATTEIRETVAGPPGAELKAVCLVPLPADVEPKSAAMTAAPPDGKPRRLAARFLAPDEARKLYEAVAKATGDVRIVSLIGRPALLVGEFTLTEKLEIAIRFTQKARTTQGARVYRCPMPTTPWARGPVERLSLTARLVADQPLRAVFSPTHDAEVERKGLREALVRVKADRWTGAEQFALYYVADRDELGLRVLAHRPEETDDGYFLLVGNPTGSAAAERVLAKDVLFVLDTSGSMRGEKIEQARAAVEHCLRKLNPGDRFNIVTFGTDVSGFRDALVDNRKAHVQAACEFVDEVVARGRTNISGALAKGLAGAGRKGRLRIMIFLTDGTPTAGELVPDKIVRHLPEWNTSGTQVFVLGVGHDVNAHLLDKLAAGTDGSCEYVGPEEDIDVKIAALYERLSNPVLSDVHVAFGGLRPHSVFPKKLPALFKGSQVMIAGRYRKGGAYRITVSGTLAGEAVRYACTASFPDAAGGDSEFVAPLWAARKIGFLLRQIRLNGESQELIEEIVRLSRKFGIVTEYTSFIAASGRADNAKETYATAAALLRDARGQQTGQWAVNQARNELDLLKRVVTAPSVNRYRDRRGRLVAADNVRQVGGRVFYLRNGQWVDAEAAGKRRTRTVKLFSEEYFELLRKDRNFARAQAVGWNMSVNVGDERIVIEKDGKTRLDQPPERRQQQPGVNQIQLRRNEGR